MKLVIENEIKKDSILKIGDIVESKETKCTYAVVIIRNGAFDVRYALMDLVDGCYANGSYISLEDLKESIHDKYLHYPSDEFELLLQKKKKC